MYEYSEAARFLSLFRGLALRYFTCTEGNTKSPGRQDPQVRVSDIAPRGQLPRQRG